LSAALKLVFGFVVFLLAELGDAEFDPEIRLFGPGGGVFEHQGLGVGEALFLVGGAGGLEVGVHGFYAEAGRRWRKRWEWCARGGLRRRRRGGGRSPERGELREGRWDGERGHRDGCQNGKYQDAKWRNGSDGARIHFVLSSG
jgi:hypothetical protein